MEIKTREELIKLWNTVKGYKNEDKRHEYLFIKVSTYLEFIEKNNLQGELKFVISAIAGIKKYISDEFLKLSKFDEIIKYISDYKNESSFPSFSEQINYDYLFIVLEFLHNKLISYNYNDTEIDKIFKAYEKIFKTKNDEKGNKLKQDLVHYLDFNLKVITCLFY